MFPLKINDAKFNTLLLKRSIPKITIVDSWVGNMPLYIDVFVMLTITTEKSIQCTGIVNADLCTEGNVALGRKRACQSV